MKMCRAVVATARPSRRLEVAAAALHAGPKGPQPASAGLGGALYRAVMCAFAHFLLALTEQAGLGCV